jgi:hypothetical protein
MPDTLSAVVFEALDPQGQMRFWSHALGWPYATDTRLAGPHGVDMVFVQTQRAKTTKNRLHLDLFGGAQAADHVERLLDLGARPEDIGQGDVPWTVLADPEGNEFCVLPEGHPGTTDGPRGLLTAICLDAADPGTLGRFWSVVTGWEVVEAGDQVARLRRDPEAAIDLVLGPPVAPKADRNRAWLEIRDAGPTPGMHRDPEDNEYVIVP